MGCREKKENTVSDFVAAAEYLIDKGYTTSSKIIANGASNGGLIGGLYVRM